MEDAGVLDLPGLYLPPESRHLPLWPRESALRDLIVPGVGGRRVFRILVQDACKHDCQGCPMASQRALGPLAEPRRLARAFVAAYRRGWCDGVFVTAGVPRSATWATEKLLEVVETLRYTLGFRGYVHVKVPPGADPRQLARMMGLVDRVSFQLEPACSLAEQGLASFPAPETLSQKSAARAPRRRREARTRTAEPVARESFAGFRRSRVGVVPHGPEPQPRLF